MKIDFLTAKNGSKTCLINEKYLHSSYNPEKEAERFVSLSDKTFTPKTIIVTEPALSYCAKFLREQFPNAKIIAIRFCKEFDFCNNFWDKIFYAESSAEKLENELFNFLGEEDLLCSMFLSWQASANAFPETNEICWKAIKNAVEKSRTVLTTRAYFAKRWLKNTVKFFFLLNKTVQIKKGSCQIIITASGPSLLSSIPFIKQHRELFFVIALSSSIEVLLHNQIIPDLCFSTDGGFYAKRHLEILEKIDKSIPLALSCESACSSKLLQQNTILPLSYNDFPGCNFYNALDIKPYFAQRNGTVSGTAIQFALSVTDADILVCGLDMSEAKGFQHTQPNALEKTDELSDYRLKTKMQRLSISGFHSNSMEIYKNWFSNQNTEFTNRVKRISHNFKYNNKLGKISDIDWKDVTIQFNKIKPSFLIESQKNNKKNKSKIINQLLDSISSSENWLKNAFPADYISYSKCNNETQKDKLKFALDQKNENLLVSLRKILYV